METSKEYSEPSMEFQQLSKSDETDNDLSMKAHHVTEKKLLNENNGYVENMRGERESHNRLRIEEEQRKCSAERKVRFADTSDMNVQSAESEETREVWETVWESRSTSLETRTDSVSQDQRSSVVECLRVTDLDDEEETGRSDRVGEEEEDGESAEGAQSRHCCGSLYAQCGATRDTSLVTKYTPSSHEPVISLNEILAERNRMCRLGDEPMGNGVSSLGKDKGQGVYSVRPTGDSKENVAGTVALLKREAQQWEEKSTELGEEVSALQKEARRKDHEILRLQREVHKLKVSRVHCRV